jgi:hypothetical protein
MQTLLTETASVGGNVAATAKNAVEGAITGAKQVGMSTGDAVRLRPSSMLPLPRAAGERAGVRGHPPAPPR